MTLAELTTLCFAKIDEKDPLQLPEPPSVVYSSEEYEAAVNEIAEQYAARSDYSTMLMHAISEVYATLHEELGLSRDEVQQLPPDTQLPPRANELAEKLRNFPHELREGTAETILTFEGLKHPQIPDELISQMLLAHPRIDFDHRNKPKRNSFLGTLFLDDHKKIKVDFLYWFDGTRFWIYSWASHEWEEPRQDCPFFNFQVNP